VVTMPNVMASSVVR